MGVGFENAETFQMLEKNLGLQEQTKGKIVWIDEADFLGAKQMAWLTEFARENALRVILSGDSAQHHTVERGDSLRVLEAFGALEAVSLTDFALTRDVFFKLGSGCCFNNKGKERNEWTQLLEKPSFYSTTSLASFHGNDRIAS